MSAKRKSSESSVSTHEELDEATGFKKTRTPDAEVDRKPPVGPIGDGYLSTPLRNDPAADSEDSDEDSALFEGGFLGRHRHEEYYATVLLYRQRKEINCPFTIESGLLDFDIMDVPSEVYHAVVQLRHMSLRYYFVHPRICTQNPADSARGLRREVMVGHIGRVYRESGNPDLRLVCQGNKTVFEWEVHSTLLKNASGYFSACLDAAKGNSENGQRYFEILDPHGGPATVDRAIISVYGTRRPRDTNTKLHYLSESVSRFAREQDDVHDYAFADYYAMPVFRSQAIQRYSHKLEAVKLSSNRFFELVKLIYSLSAGARLALVATTLDIVAKRRAEIFPGYDASAREKVKAERFQDALKAKALHEFAVDLNSMFDKHCE